MTTAPPTRRRTASLVLFVLLALALTASAQEPDDTSAPTSTATSWLTLPVRVGGFVAVLMVTWAFGFYAFFPWVLGKKDARRPLSAYGLSAGLIWLAWCGSALLAFQNFLVQESFDTGGPLGPFLKDWLLTCLICLAALIGFALLRMIFRGHPETTGS